MLLPSSGVYVTTADCSDATVVLKVSDVTVAVMSPLSHLGVKFYENYIIY